MLGGASWSLSGWSCAELCVFGSLTHHVNCPEPLVFTHQMKTLQRENSWVTYPKPHSWDLNFKDEKFGFWMNDNQFLVFCFFFFNLCGFQQHAPLAASCMTFLRSQLWEHSPLGCAGHHHTRPCQPAPLEAPSSLLRHKINHSVYTGNLKLSAQMAKMFNLSFSLRQGIFLWDKVSQELAMYTLLALNLRRSAWPCLSCWD